MLRNPSDGFFRRQSEHTVNISKCSLVNDLSEPIVVIEDNGERTLVHPNPSPVNNPLVKVSWNIVQNGGRVSDTACVLGESDFHTLNLATGRLIKIKYIPAIPATIIIGLDDASLSNAVLRDAGKSVSPICLSEDTTIIGKWLVDGDLFSPIIYQLGAGAMTSINPKTLRAVRKPSLAGCVVVDGEYECLDYIKSEIVCAAHSAYFSTIVGDFSVSDINSQSLILNEHKILAEESKQESMQLATARTAVDAIAKLVR